MKWLSKRFVIILLVIAIIFIATNPSERKYLNRVATDYGALHHGMSFDEQSLLSIGESYRSNYLLFSTYKYQFGNISVSYLGIGSFIFFLSSSSEQSHSNKEIPATS